MPQHVQNPIYAVVWTPDHKQVFTASFDKTIKLWDVASGNLVREFKAAPGPEADRPQEGRAEEGEEERRQEGGPEDGHEAFQEGLVRSEPPRTSRPAVGHRDQVFSIALTKDGKFLASGSSDRTLKLWEVATGRVVREFPNPDLKPVFPGEPRRRIPAGFSAVRFTPDGQFLVTAGPAPRGKSYLAVWKVADGKRVYGAEREFGPIHSVAITPGRHEARPRLAPLRGQIRAGRVLVIKLPGK